MTSALYWGRDQRPASRERIEQFDCNNCQPKSVLYLEGAFLLQRIGERI